MKFHQDGTLPANRSAVFVFGSNLAGKHLGGAARAAETQFGAESGVACGQTGQSYAIPTMNESFETLSLEDIGLHVAQFIQHARRNAVDEFFITRIGCVIAGYSDAEIAPMFAGAPENCSFAEAWGEYL